MTQLEKGNKVMRSGELGVVKEVSGKDLETPVRKIGGVEFIDAPTGGIVIEWNGLGSDHAQRYTFAQIDELGIKVVG